MSRPTVDRVIVGLRNPGADYVGTRHNVGAEVVGVLAGRHDISLARGPLRVRAEMGQGTIGDLPIALVLPLPFMNDCGPVVTAALRWYHLGPEDLLGDPRRHRPPLRKAPYRSRARLRWAQRSAIGDAVAGRRRVHPAQARGGAATGTDGPCRLRAPAVRSCGATRSRSARRGCRRRGGGIANRPFSGGEDGGQQAATVVIRPGLPSTR